MQSTLTYQLTSSPGNDSLYSWLDRSFISQIVEPSDAKFWNGEKEMVETTCIRNFFPGGQLHFPRTPFCVPPSEIIISIHTSDNGSSTSLMASSASLKAILRGNFSLPFLGDGGVITEGSKQCGKCPG